MDAAHKVADLPIILVQENPLGHGLMLDESSLLPLAIRAAKFYEGAQGIISCASIPPLVERVVPDEHTVLNNSEFSHIYPLFCLYAEEKSALVSGMARIMGDHDFGRGVSEIRQDIKEQEGDMVNTAFCEDIISI